MPSKNKVTKNMSDHPYRVAMFSSLLTLVLPPLAVFFFADPPIYPHTKEEAARMYLQKIGIDEHISTFIKNIDEVKYNGLKITVPNLSTGQEAILQRAIFDATIEEYSKKVPEEQLYKLVEFFYSDEMNEYAESKPSMTKIAVKATGKYVFEQFRK